MPAESAPGSVAVSVPSPRWRRWLPGALLLLVLALAAWLRLSRLDFVLFEYDEAQWSGVALRLARGQEFPLAGIKSLVGVATGPAFLYLLALPMLISTDPSVLTGFIGVLNLAGVGLTFAFTCRYFGLAAAAVAGFLYAANPWAVYHSRKVWNPDVLPLLSIVFFWSLYMALLERRPRYLPLAAVAAAVALQLNQAAFCLPVLLALVVLLRWRQLGSRAIAAALLAALVVSAPFLYYEASNGWVDVRSALQVSGAAVAVDGEALRHALRLAAGWDFPGEVFGIWTKPGESVPDVTAANVLVEALLALGGGVALVRLALAWRRREWGEAGKWALLLSWLVVPVALLTRHGFELHMRYLLTTQPSQFILAGVGVAWLGDRLAALTRQGNRRQWLAPAAGWLVALLPALFVAGAQSYQYNTVLALTERNGLEQIYGVPVAYYRQAFNAAVRLSSDYPVEPVYVWAPERAIETVRYFAAANNLPIRQATERQQLLLGAETGRDRLYLLCFGDAAVDSRLRQLGFRPLAGEDVPVPGGQTTFRFYRLPAGNTAAIAAALGNVGPDLRFDNGLWLARWQLSPLGAPADRLQLVAAWEVWRQPDLSAPDPNYCLSQHLQDGGGKDLAAADITLEQMRLLQPGDLLLSWSEVTARSELERQRASLVLGMFHCWQRDVAGLLDGGGRPTEAALRLGPVTVGRQPDSAASLAPQHAVGAALGERIALLGFDLADSPVKSGGEVQLRLYWQARQAPARDYTVFVQLLHEGQLVAQRDGPPRAGKYPTSLWQTGEAVADDYMLPLPPSAPPGTYTLIAGMYTPEDVRRLPVVNSQGNRAGDHVELAKIQVASPAIPDK
ncbi:MAG: glycosyltransferase family 39 protein [Chloroflexota bacterium]